MCACAVGKYQSQGGQAKCVTCEAEKYQAQAGQASNVHRVSRRQRSCWNRQNSADQLQHMRVRQVAVASRSSNVHVLVGRYILSHLNRANVGRALHGYNEGEKRGEGRGRWKAQGGGLATSRVQKWVPAH